MSRFSGKIDIINHFDKLINKVDIDIDQCLEKCNDQQLLSDLLDSTETNRTNFRNRYDDFDVKFFDTYNSSKHQSLDTWAESRKVVDYLKQTRMKTIDELKKAQEETLQYYSDNSSRFKSELTNEKTMEELKSELYAEKHFFQVRLKQSERRLWPFNVFTFVTDFYLSQFYIDSLE
jgi:hypothetical protein